MTQRQQAGCPTRMEVRMQRSILCARALIALLGLGG
jgi:hypothetical protein